MFVSVVAPLGLMCGGGEFRCHVDSSCIPADLVCDGVDNCADGSDESSDNEGCVGRLLGFMGGVSVNVNVCTFIL